MPERYLGRIMPDMDVCDVNGEKIGVVAQVYRHEYASAGGAGASAEMPPEDTIEIKTGFLGLGRHLYVPMGAVQEVTHGCVFLSGAYDEVKEAGWDRRPPHLT